jgi:signal transduction histidine kinase/FixJ family two-component response regulator
MNPSLKSPLYGYLVTIWLTLSVSSIVLGGVLAVEGAAAHWQLQRSLVIAIATSVLGAGTGILALYFARVANDREKSERLLAERALRAERATREKSLFMANMSHEIRTPMNAILGFSEMLAAELPSESKHRQRAQTIRESALSLLQLINDILDLSKVEAGILEIHREPTDPREITTFMRTIFAQQAARKGLQLQVMVASEVPPVLQLDRARLQQVLVNLLANAVKFTSAGRVTMRALWVPEPEQPQLGTLILEVEDTGSGIPVEKQEAIFQPFMQLDTLNPVRAQGSGLGLSIVRRLTERMGGQVTLASTVGRGSVFRLIFPRTAAVGPALPSPTESDEPVDFNELPASTILVVDDNAVNRELLADMFGPTHHVLRFATNGREAVEAVGASRPDVVLMDLRMPELDGPGALAEIRRLPGGNLPPVIAVTASKIPEEEEIRPGFAEHIRKPFTRRVLFQALARVLPRLGRRAPAPPGPEKRAAVAIMATPEAWPALIRELTGLERERWPEVRATGAVSNVRQFARQLADLAQARGCPPLQEYADGLRRDAADFAINRIEKRLADFPDLIRLIDRRTAPALPASAA